MAGLTPPPRRRGSCVRDLHLGLDRAAERGLGHPAQCSAPVYRGRAALRIRRRRRLDDVPLDRIRLLRVGDVGRAPPRRTARDRTGRGDARRRCLACSRAARARDRAQPDTERLPRLRRGGRRGRATAELSALRRVRRRSARPAHAQGMDRRARRRAASAREHVRDHRDHRPRHVPPDASPGRAGLRPERHRVAASRHAHRTPCSGRPTRRGGRGRRDLGRRRGSDRRARGGTAPAISVASFPTEISNTSAERISRSSCAASASSSARSKRRCARTPTSGTRWSRCAGTR